jgi:hypothetical protein
MQRVVFQNTIRDFSHGIPRNPVWRPLTLYGFGSFKGITGQSE